ncbi:MAG: hypothetical protein MJ236_03700 [Clostridia bacterium]|nr:hypothetical protein [Clostridia bacterium]
MSVDYTRVSWTTSKYINPTNMNQMDKGIKDCADEINRIETRQLVGTYDSERTTWQEALIAMQNDLADYQSVHARVLYKPSGSASNSAVFVSGVKTGSGGRYWVYFTSGPRYVVFDTSNHFTSYEFTQASATQYPT